MLRCLPWSMLALASSAFASPPHLVKDINRSGSEVSPEIAWAEALGGRMIFSRTSSAIGQELWVAGESGVAKPLKDIHPGPAGSLDFQFTPISDGTQLYFQADDGRHGVELWRTDGTTRGTRMVADLVPGLEGSGATPLHAAGGQVFFQTGEAYHLTLWCKREQAAAAEALNPRRNDGTRLFEGFEGFGSFATIGKDTYFFSGAELWKSDGTAAGTALVETLPFEASFEVKAMHAANGTLFLKVINGSSGQIWTSRGTAGSTRRLEAVGNHDGIYFRPFVSMGQQVFFVMGAQNCSLWASDGTEAGTRQLPLSDGGQTSRPVGLNLVEYQGAIYFDAFDPAFNHKIWRSDGTPQGSFPIEDLGYDPSGYQIDLKAAGNWLYFSARRPSDEYSLWKTDGSPGAATKIKVLYVDGANALYPLMAATGDSLFFGAEWGSPEEGLWRTQGDPLKTTRITDVETITGDAFEARSQSPFIGIKGGGSVFGAKEGEGKVELWLSKGSGRSTRPIWSPPYPETEIQSVGTHRGEAIFSVAAPSWRELWITDGKGAGTRFLTNFSTGDKETYSMGTVPAGEVSYFVMLQNSAYRLWQTDGSAEGTFEIQRPTDGSRFWLSSSQLVLFQGGVYFLADGGVGKMVLWRAPANGEGAVEKIKEIDFSTPGFSVMPLAVGGRIEFFVRRGENQSELWTSNGTEAGTHAVATLSGNVGFSANVGGQHLFLLDEGAEENWYRTNGTLAGTQAYAAAAGAGEDPFVFVPESHSGVAGKSFFYFVNNSSGTALWKTDGTSKGTHMLKQIYHELEVTRSVGLVAAGNKVYFNGGDSEHGVELWRSDGTPAGTRMIRDLKRGPASSSPSGLKVIGRRLFFHAEGNGVGRELHAMDLPN